MVNRDSSWEFTHLHVWKSVQPRSLVRLWALWQKPHEQSHHSGPWCFPESERGMGLRTCNSGSQWPNSTDSGEPRTLDDAVYKASQNHGREGWKMDLGQQMGRHYNPVVWTITINYYYFIKWHIPLLVNPVSSHYFLLQQSVLLNST